MRAYASADDRLIERHLDGGCTDGGFVDVRGGRARDRAKTFGSIVAGLTVVLAIWGLFALFFNGTGASALRFPTPVETFARLGEYLFEGRSLYGQSIYAHVGASVQRLLVAFSLAAAFGIVLGSVLGYFTRIYAIGMAPVSIFQMIPGLAWLPIAILLFGLGDESAVFIIFAVSSMVITVDVAGGIRMVPAVLVRAAKMAGASGPAIFLKVLVPQASVSIINALRVGMSSAWRVLIAAEMVVGTGIGLGYSIELTRDLLDYVGAFACIAVICVIGLAIDRVVLATLEKAIRHRLGLEEGY